MFQVIPEASITVGYQDYCRVNAILKLEVGALFSYTALIQPLCQQPRQAIVICQRLSETENWKPVFNQSIEYLVYRH